MIVRNLMRAAGLAALVLVATVSTASAQVGVGVKGGVVFPSFSSDDLDFKNKTGYEAGLFLGGNRTGVVGAQVEFNWLQKKTDVAGVGDLKIDYFQIPVLLRLNAGTSSSNNFDFYVIVGPALSFKIGDEVEGIQLDDAFETVEFGLVAGAGIEISRFILEGRYEKGFNAINNNFHDVSDINTQSFAILAGVRFK